MDTRSLLIFGEGHPVLAEVLSNGPIIIAVVIFAALCLYTWKGKGFRFAFHLGTVGAVATLATYAIVDIIKRTHPVPRPFVALGMPPAFPEPDAMTSFPSAHSAVVTAIVVIFLLEWRRHRDMPRAIASALLLSLIPLVWVGRMIAGHHYLVDVLVGSTIGVIVSYAVYRGVEKWRS